MQFSFLVVSCPALLMESHPSTEIKSLAFIFSFCFFFFSVVVARGTTSDINKMFSNERAEPKLAFFKKSVEAVLGPS